MQYLLRHNGKDYELFIDGDVNRVDNYTYGSNVAESTATFNEITVSVVEPVGNFTTRIDPSVKPTQAMIEIFERAERLINNAA